MADDAPADAVATVPTGAEADQAETVEPLAGDGAVQLEASDAVVSEVKAHTEDVSPAAAPGEEPVVQEGAAAVEPAPTARAEAELPAEGTVEAAAPAEASSATVTDAEEESPANVVADAETEDTPQAPEAPGAAPEPTAEEQVDRTAGVTAQASAETAEAPPERETFDDPIVRLAAGRGKKQSKAAESAAASTAAPLAAAMGEAAEAKAGESRRMDFQEVRLTISAMDDAGDEAIAVAGEAAAEEPAAETVAETLAAEPEDSAKAADEKPAPTHASGKSVEATRKELQSLFSQKEGRAGPEAVTSPRVEKSPRIKGIHAKLGGEKGINLAMFAGGAPPARAKRSSTPGASDGEAGSKFTADGSGASGGQLDHSPVLKRATQKKRRPKNRADGGFEDLGIEPLSGDDGEKGETPGSPKVGSPKVGSPKPEAPAPGSPVPGSPLSGAPGAPEGTPGKKKRKRRCIIL